MVSEEALAALAHGELCRRLAVRAGEVAAGRGVRLLAFKGLALAAQGDGALDLHRRPLPWGCGGPSARELFRRGVPGPPALAPLWVPAMDDCGALAVAHWAKDAFGLAAPGSLARDLAILAAAGLTASALGQRLRETGLRRVGAVALARLSAEDPRWAPFRDACGPTPADERWAARWARLPPAVRRRGLVSTPLLAACVETPGRPLRVAAAAVAALSLTGMVSRGRWRLARPRRC